MITNFTGFFLIQNWTQVPNSGVLNTSNAPLSITLTSGNSYIPDTTIISISIPITGLITFNWSSTTTDGDLSWDSFGYVLNGNFNSLADGSPKSMQGVSSIPVNIGDVFGFCVNTFDGDFGPSTTNISNFVFTYNDTSFCYNESSLILILKNDLEQYIKIEDLRKGDLVKTYLHGYKPIELIGKKKFINDPKQRTKSMYKINDLILTGKHSILVDDKPNRNRNKNKIDDKYCLLVCDYNKAQRIIDNNIYTIYHLALEGENERYGIYANNGILTESTCKSNFIKHNFTLLE